jgi:hypothetical protein
VSAPDVREAAQAVVNGTIAAIKTSTAWRSVPRELIDALRAALDAPLAAPSGGDATRDEAVRARDMREACLALCEQRAAVHAQEATKLAAGTVECIIALYRGCEALWFRNAIRALPLPPAPAASAPAAIRDLSGDLAAMAKGIDEECCCVACGREVAPSPCCPDYPVWPGPCRSCYSIDATPADDAVARAREEVIAAAKAQRAAAVEAFHARGATRSHLEAVWDGTTNVTQDAVARLLAAERDAKGGGRG